MKSEQQQEQNRTIISGQMDQEAGVEKIRRKKARKHKSRKAQKKGLREISRMITIVSKIQQEGRQ